MSVLDGTPTVTLTTKVPETLGIYVLLDVFGRPLYIGASHDMDRRVRQHHAKPWWESVASVETHPMETWEQALYVERNLIVRLNPEFNRQSNDDEKRFNNLITGSMLRYVEGVPA